MRVGVTGGTGFVGSALLPSLTRAGHEVVMLVRRAAALPAGIECRPTGPLETADLVGAVAGVDVVIHLAGLAHRPRGAEPEAAYDFANLVATRRLAEASARAGVPRLVFASTLLVHGDESPADLAGPAPVRADSPAKPADTYARSKWAAEEALRTIAAATGLEVAIVRPPLVHGPGAKGNLRSLMHALRRGVPLPLAGIANRRSLVGVENLARLLTHLACTSRATGAFLVSDGEDVSTPELVRRLGNALGRPSRLVRCPPAILRSAASIVGRGSLGRSLCGSLFVDARPTQDLGWRPTVPLDASLRAMARSL